MYPHERSLVQRLAKSPFALIGVNSDPMENVQDALVRENITWRSFFNGGSTGGPISGAWGVTGWPTIYVIDHEGVIRFKNVRGEAMDKAVDELLGPAMAAVVANLKSEDAAVRGLAAFHMGLYNAPDAVTTIAGLLKDADVSVQQRTATALALLGQPVTPLLPQIRAAVVDVDPEVRVASLQVLSVAKDAESAALALKALEDKNVSVVLAALQTLAQVGDSSSAPALAKLVDNPSLRVAREAVNALASLGTPESRQLLDALAAKADHPARTAIAVAMYRVDPAAAEVLVKALFADQDVKFRRQIAKTVKDLAGYDPTELFIKALEDTDAQVRKTSREFLAQSENPQAKEALQVYMVAQIEKLVPQLADRDARTGSAARTQLADLGAEAAPLLWERLLKVEDTMEEGNQRAIQMLAQLVGMARNPTVTPALLEQIKNSELPPDRRTAYENALRFVAGDIRSDLQELAKSDAVPLRLSAVRLLPNAADESAIAALKESLKDADPGVRSWAACGLARSKDADAVPLLKDAAMNSDDVLLQRQSLMSLVQYGEQTALPVLQALLAGEDKAKRWQAFQLLEYFPSPEVTKLVVELAADDPALDSMAPMILYRHANVEAARALGAYLDSDQPRLRAQVQSMLKSMRGVPEAGEILEEFLKRQAEEKAKAEAEKGAKDKPDGGSGKK